MLTTGFSRSSERQISLWDIVSILILKYHKRGFDHFTGKRRRERVDSSFLTVWVFSNISSYSKVLPNILQRS